MTRQLFAGMAIAAILLLSPNTAQGSTIRMLPSPTNVPLGSSFHLDILAENMNLGGFDFTIGFNAGLVGITAAEPDVFLGDPSAFEAFFDASLGLISVQTNEVSLLDPATLLALQGDASANSFRLVRLTFQTVAPGVAEFTFPQSLLTGVDASPVTANHVLAQVTIETDTTPVPEPASWTLITGLALIALRCVIASQLKQRSMTPRQ